MFEFLFKYSRTMFENGEVLSAEGWPIWAFALFFAVLCASIFWSLFKQKHALSLPRLGLVGLLQIAMLAVVAAMFWQPTLQVDTILPGENRVILLLDSSESMRYGEDGQTRLAQVQEALQDSVIEEISELADLQIATFDSGIQEVGSLSEIPSPGVSTNLAGALLTTLNEARQAPLTAVVVATDGSDNSGEANAEWLNELRNFRTPVHTIGVGREHITEDTELTTVSLPAVTTPNTRQTVNLTIQSGADQPADLKIFSGDRVLASEQVNLREGVGTYSLEFDSSEEGVYDLEFVLEPQAGENNRINNRQHRILQVRDEPKRILYVEGEPRWEYKFIRRAIEGDSSISISTLLRTSPNKFYRQGIESPEELEEGFPVDRETLFKYDALIIGSIEAASFTPEQLLNIREFVSERGGSLLMLGGQRGLNQGGWGAVKTTADLLPVDLASAETETFDREQLPVSLTRDGSLSPILRLAEDPEENRELWDSLPALADYQEIGTPKPGAAVLLEVERQGETLPLMVTQRYGLGSSTILATGGTWRWQMQLPSDDLTHETFWSRLLQSLVAGAPEKLKLSTGLAEYGEQREVVVEAELRDDLFRPVTDASLTALAVNQSEQALPVVLTPAEGRPGIYQGLLNAEQAGDWRIDLTARSNEQSETELGETSHYFKRTDGISEHFGIAQNRSLLQQIADETGGQYWSISQLAGLPDALKFSQSGIQERQLLPLWNMPILFLLLLGLKSLEWCLRLLWRRL